MSNKPSFKRGMAVTFQTTGRGGRGPARKGKVRQVYETLKGAFVLIKGDDGNEYRARPALVSAA